MLILLFCLAIVSGDGQFECGDHGRFEYCIEEIPGCVIGCHCHPGYYFDTETKICEPNIKLTQNYRRYLQPYNANLISTETSHKQLEVTDATTTRDIIDYQVDEITKNADDLGDWLYNQFFKTIESQVINNTKENKIPNRRSGTGPLIKNISRKKASRKKSKRAKQQKKNKSSMRRKLLRITENDSVFDSSSESRSDTSESSSDDSGSSFEIHQNDERRTDDREHGHKKIVIINKKAKPPLPSFIFLPNMDTPFYPPIGLPPPPIMPMYPIVPVPPMPVFPCPEHDENGSSTAATTITTSTAHTHSLATSQASIETSAASIPTVEEDIETSTTADTAATTESKKLYRGGRYKKKNKEKIFQQRNSISEVYNGNKNPPHGQREKLRIRQKYRKPAYKLPVQDDDITENPFIEDNGIDDTFNNEIQPNPGHDSNLRPDNVDFKYISELIHRSKPIDTHKPIESTSPIDSVEVYRPAAPYKNKKQAARIPKETTRRDDSDDSYYTNLGRQIASIIRSADAQNQQVNIEIEHTNQNNENHVFFNDNSPRSLWERSVRSPVTFLNSNKNRFDYLKKSNELLFDIENKVSIVASTAPSLSLHEIENMINVVEKAQRKIKKKQIGVNNVKESNRNFNINLWPRDNQRTEKLNFQPVLKASEMNSNSNKMPEIHGISMHNFQRFTAWLSTGKTNQTQNNEIYKTNTKTPTKNAKYSTNSQTRPAVHLHLSLPTEQRLNTSTNLNKPIFHRQAFDSILPKYKYNMENKKYFQDISNGQDDDGSLIPMKRVMHQLVNKQIVQQPSYFHRGINHFDYF